MAKLFIYVGKIAIGHEQPLGVLGMLKNYAPALDANVKGVLLVFEI